MPFLSRGEGALTAVCTWRATEADRASALSRFRARRVIEELGGAAGRPVLASLLAIAAYGEPVRTRGRDVAENVVRLRGAIESGQLLLVQGWDDTRESADVPEAATSAARLVGAVMGGRRFLVVDGQSYRLMPVERWLREARKSEWRVVALEQATPILQRMARDARSPVAAARDVWAQVAGELVSDARVRKGIVLVVLRPVSIRPSASDEPAVTPSAAKKAAPQHWVEFRVQDLGGRPIKGAPFRLNLPGGDKEKGKLDGSGSTSRHEQLPSGSATLELAEITEAAWADDDVDAHNGVDLTAAVSGVDPGTLVKFEVFRHYRERAGDVVAKLQGTLDGEGRVVATWTPDEIEAPDDDYVFKVNVGPLWRKSDVLVVQQRPMTAEWSQTVANEGDEVALKVSVRGIADGEKATIRVFEKDWLEGDDEEAAKLDAEVTAGAVTATWAPQAPETPPPFGDDGSRDFYYSLEVGDLSMLSGLLRVTSRAPSDEDG